MKPTWQTDDGQVQLYLADCLTVLPTLETGSVDAVITDPPYGIINQFGESTLYGFRRMQFEFDGDHVPAMITNAMDAALRLQPKAFHIFCDPEHYGAIAKVARLHDFTPKPWVKLKLCPPPPMPGNWWPSAFELAMYGYRHGAWFGDLSAKRSNVMIFDSYRFGIRASEKIDHPTQKWLPMITYLVGTICQPDGVVLDPFMGSGTTGVACIMLRRRFIGIEISEAYFNIAVKRIEQAKMQLHLPLQD